MTSAWDTSLRRSTRIQNYQRLNVTNPDRGTAPFLATAGRGRNYHIPSQEDKENQAVEEMKNFKFKAKRAPDYIFEGPSGVPDKKKRKVTVPKTPMIMKRKVTKREPKKETVKRLGNARPMPDLSKGFNIKKAPKTKKTQLLPFSFDGKYKLPDEIKEQLLKQTVEKEEEARKFKAQDLVLDSDFAVDKTVSKPVTIPKPFNLAIPDFHEKTKQKMEETIRKEEEESEKKREFKAKFPMVLYQDAFIPEKNSQISEMAEFNLHSDKRGDKRRVFDEEVKATQQQRELEQEAHEAALKVIEAQEIAELRKKMVHKANNIGEYKPQSYEDIA